MIGEPFDSETEGRSTPPVPADPLTVPEEIRSDRFAIVSEAVSLDPLHHGQRAEEERPFGAVPAAENAHLDLTAGADTVLAAADSPCMTGFPPSLKYA